MSEDDVASARFAGRTYGRSRQKLSQGGADESIVQVKAAVSMSKWGKANYVPFRDGSDQPGEAKKIKLEAKAEDPFSFESEDKTKTSPVKKQAAATTLLPASRIDTKGKGVEEFAKSDKPAVTPTPLRTYSRTSKTPNNDDQDDHFVEVGKTTVNTSGDRVFIQSQQPSEEEDDIFPAEFKRDPLKTYAGEVVTPVDKPDSPPPKSRYKYQKKGVQRGRKPLTVSDPGLIEQYKRNYEAQQMKGKTDTDTRGLYNSMVVSKKEMTNEDQGTTMFVVCKPKAQVEKGEVQIKYFSKSPRKTPGAPAEVVSSSQEEGHASENGKSDSPAISSSSEAAPTRSSARIRSATTTPASSQGTLSPGSNPASAVRVLRGRNSNADWSHPTSGSDSSPATDSSKGGKRYRIFKSRAPQVEPSSQESKLQEEDENPIPESEEGTQPTELSEESKSEAEFTQETMEEDVKEDDMPSLTPEDSATFTEECEVDSSTALEEETEGTVAKEMDSATARQSLATRLRNMEKGHDSDSTEQDNLSECSEGVQYQESSQSSQPTADEGSQKEEAGVSGVSRRRFFKSKNTSDIQRKLLSSSPQKSPAKATYNARSWHSESGGDKEDKGEKEDKRGSDGEDMMLVRDSRKAPRLSREVHWPERTYDEAYTSLKVNKKHKQLYTVVHNVKQTHEVQELGETQDFMDDVDYLLDSLRDSNSTSIRCLSCLKLAGKCIMPAFRMHLRAHGTVTKIFSLLHDACKDPSLALSTSAMMFMMSRDRLNMDLDKQSLNLMLRLNEVDAVDKGAASDSSLKDVVKIKERVTELLAQLQQETHAREIDLGFVSTGNLAMESLLSLTSRRAGEWFKEELRMVGGLDHIVDSVVSCDSQLPAILDEDMPRALPNLKKLDRCLRVLENISFMNADNQSHLRSYKEAAILAACERTLRRCQHSMVRHPVLENPEENKAVRETDGFLVLTCLLAVLRVLLNITHEHKLGESPPEVDERLIGTTLLCLTNTQWCIPVEQRFDLAVLCLGLLINLLEGKKENHRAIMGLSIEVKATEKSTPKQMKAVHAIVQLFSHREEAARQMEEDSEEGATPDQSSCESPNKSGEWKETEVGIQWITNNLKKAKEQQQKEEEEAKAAAAGGEGPGEEEGEGVEGNQSILEEDEETFTKALHKAGKHMENSIVASYAGLLLGSIIMDNEEYAATVKTSIPNGDFSPMIKILRKFLNFMSLTTAFGSTDVNGITRVIQVLEAA